MLRRACLVASLAVLAACGNAFEPASSIQSLRILGVRADQPYAKPGATVRYDILYYDGSKRAFDAQGQRRRKVQVLWLGGCHDPPGDLYYGCFPILAQLFAGLGGGGSGGAPPGGGSGGPSPLSLIGQGDTFQLSVPEDIISRRPPVEVAVNNAEGNIPYGLSYVFFAVCGGEIRPVPADQVAGGLPLGCFDTDTNERLYDDDFVIGYTPLYSYDAITNKNPVLAGMQFEGKDSMVRSCAQGCEEGTRCGSSGLCLPVVPHCTTRKVADCPTYKIKPRLVAAENVEVDQAAPPIDGRKPEEVIWLSYYASDGTLDNDTLLVNDSLRGWIFDSSEGSKWSAPNAPAGESRIWIVAHDNRGGAAWAWQDVFVD